MSESEERRKEEIDMSSIPEEKFVGIPREEYNQLRMSDLILEALESAGVDNRQGYDHAMEIWEQLKQKEALNPKSSIGDKMVTIPHKEYEKFIRDSAALASMSEEVRSMHPKEYTQYRKDQLELQALHDTGVDNWQGYSRAQQTYLELLDEAGLNPYS